MDITLIIATFSIISSGVAVYSLYTRNTEYKTIVEHYSTEIAELRAETSSAMEEIKKEAIESVKSINDIAVNTSQDSINIIAKNTEAEELRNMLKKIVEQQKELNYQQFQLQQFVELNSKNIDEIKKRDAIIKRLRKANS